jgi:hypothetical protein
MNAWPRLLSFFVLLAIATSIIDPQNGILFRLTGRWSQLRAAQHVLESEEFKTSRLDRQAEIVKKRLLAKSEVAIQVIEGRTSLLEAAQLFGFFNRAPSDCPKPVQGTWPGKSEGERLCRQVIHWVYQEMEETSQRKAAAFRAKLEAELAQRLRKYGTIRLPEQG